MAGGFLWALGENAMTETRLDQTEEILSYEISDEALESTAETRRAANGLLAGSEDDIDVPGVESNLLRTDTADTVHNDEGVGTDATDYFGHALDITENTRGGVDVGDGNELVGLLLEGLLDLLERGAVPDGGLDLGGIGAVGLKAVGKRVREVPCVQNESILALLDQVRGHQVPAEGTTACDDEGLRGGVGGLEELAGEAQGLSKGLDEAGSGMALT